MRGRIRYSPLSFLKSTGISGGLVRQRNSIGQLGDDCHGLAVGARSWRRLEMKGGSLSAVPVARRLMSWTASALCIAAAGFALSCGGGSFPAGPILPTPTTAPLASATNPPAGAAVCPFGNGSADAVCVQSRTAVLLPQVETAIDTAIHQHPEYFDLNQQSPAGSRQFLVL